MRWLEDLQETKANRCRKRAVDREDWASVIEEVQALRGP